MEKVEIQGVIFDNISLESAVCAASNYISSSQKTYVVTPNSEIVHMCKNNNALIKILNNSGLVLPDGIGIVYASRILKRPIKEKVAGIDFALKLLEDMDKNRSSLFLFGSSESNVSQAVSNVSVRYPNINILGYRHGYFDTDEEVIEEINSMGNADVLFVCLGAPKQEYFIHNNIDKINATLFCGLGGTIDVLSGSVNRAPKIFIDMGLEWFYRLIKEPKRFKRMLRLPLFMFDVVLHRLTGK